jgi:site-specific recombinase XerD
MRACPQFFAWCDERGLTLMTIRPVDVGRYIEARQQTHSAPDVKQQLAAVRMLFDWLITGQVAPLNPAAAVRGPKHVVKTGKTPVLEDKEWRTLIESIPADTVGDLRDCAPSPRHPHLLGLDPTVVSPSAIWARMAAKPAVSLGCRDT